MCRNIPDKTVLMLKIWWPWTSGSQLTINLVKYKVSKWWPILLYYEAVERIHNVQCTIKGEKYSGHACGTCDIQCQIKVIQNQTSRPGIQSQELNLLLNISYAAITHTSHRWLQWNDVMLSKKLCVDHFQEPINQSINSKISKNVKLSSGLDF